MTAFRAAEQAVGERMDGTLEGQNAGKNQAAGALGKLGGAKGRLAASSCAARSLLSVNSRQQPPGACHVGVVFGSEMLAQQLFFGPDARHQRNQIG